jgi:hypothetical protein
MRLGKNPQALFLRKSEGLLEGENPNFLKVKNNGKKALRKRRKFFQKPFCGERTSVLKARFFERNSDKNKFERKPFHSMKGLKSELSLNYLYTTSIHL